MRGVWLILIAGLVGAVGCTPTPKREMRQPTKEELVGPPEGAYVTPPDYTRDQGGLQPKQAGPGLNTGAAMPGLGGPAGPGGTPGGASPGGARR
jgi:hypothetical protein